VVQLTTVVNTLMSAVAIAVDEQGGLEIAGRTPAMPSRVLVTYATDRLPRRSVAQVE
jgi:hypothetical protein